MKRQAKKFSILIIFTLISALLVFGCSNNSVGSDKGSNASAQPKTPAVDAVKVDQVPWETTNIVENKSRRLAFSYTNNSEYCIVDLSLDYSVIPGTTLEELKPAYANAYSDSASLAKDIEEVTEDDVKNLKIAAEVYVATNPSETSQQDLMTIGYDYLTNDSQLEFFTPNMLTIKYIIDNKLYTETYDYLLDSYSLDSNIKDVNEWPDNEFTQLLPSPDSLIIESANVNGDKLMVETIGTSIETYDEYVLACKEAGFDKDIDQTKYSNRFEANNSDGTYNIVTSLYEEHGEMTITVTKTEGSSSSSAKSSK